MDKHHAGKSGSHCKITGNLLADDLHHTKRASTKRKNYFVGCNLFHPVAQQPTSGTGPPYYRGFTITLRHATFGRTPLEDSSARRRDLYLTSHNTHNRDIHSPEGFESAIPKSERPQTRASDRAATWIGFGCINI
jgi:hypothetical protein